MDEQRGTDAGRTAQSLIRLQDLSESRLEDVLDLAQRFKAGAQRAELAGRSVGFLFFRGSLRTRTSFEVAVHQLGGRGVHLSAGSDFWEVEARDGVVMDGTAPEHVRDAAAVLSTYCDALAIRPRPAGRSWEVDRRDEGIRAWAGHSSVPVINMESALWHPLQALADLLTLRETFGKDVTGRRLAIVWTPSPTPSGPSVVHSLLLSALRAGIDVSLAHPPGYELDGGVLSEARHLAGDGGGTLEEVSTARDAARGADVVYARSWAALESYGKPTLAAHRVAQRRDWLVDENLMQLGREARLMHPMPVRRNLEVTDAVLDGPRSLVYAQAANRLPTQKGLLSLLLRG
ncbi:MAG: N-acetylornithine carbamoyltransferase [Planctomycetota bacterium]